METVAGAEGVDEAMFEDGPVGKTSPSNSPTKQISDPVVYKLVRVIDLLAILVFIIFQQVIIFVAALGVWVLCLIM